MSAIDWEKLEGDFIELSEGVPKKLVLTNWRNQDKFKDEKTQAIKKGITFDVVEEDGKKTKKEYTVTAMKAIKQITPIIQEADKAGKTQIVVTIVKVGTGPKTVYSISRG